MLRPISSCPRFFAAMCFSYALRQRQARSPSSYNTRSARFQESSAARPTQIAVVVMYVRCGPRLQSAASSSLSATDSSFSSGPPIPLGIEFPAPVWAVQGRKVLLVHIPQSGSHRGTGGVQAFFAPAIVLAVFVAAGAVCPEAGVCARITAHADTAAAVGANKRWLIRSLPSEMAERANFRSRTRRAVRMLRIERGC
jgi:hypothetical protein